LELERELMPGS